jgi:putative DNA primase/helicase
MASMIEAAVELGRRGFRVHPLKSKDAPYTAYSRTATSIEADIRALWQRFPDALIGICTGDGLVVIDDDRGLASPDHSLPATLTASTPSRGWHHYYSCETPLRNSVGKLAPGIDVRGQGGYVVAPPSEGRAWYHVDLPIAPLPALILTALLREEQRQRASFEPRPHVPAGERHDYLVRMAGWLVANEIAEDLEDLANELIAHAERVCDDWPSHEWPGVRKNIKSIARWVLAREAGG